jgi:hypothetical protein
LQLIPNIPTGFAGFAGFATVFSKSILVWYITVAGARRAGFAAFAGLVQIFFGRRPE